MNETARGMFRWTAFHAPIDPRVSSYKKMLICRYF
jgi:hypothetical protein